MESHRNTEDYEEVVGDQINVSSLLEVFAVQQLIQLLCVPRQ